MVLARNELARRLRESASDVPVDGAFERLSSIIAEMRDAITRTRMQRIENLFVGLPRMVRDLSAELGKQVLVDIEGGDVELDREMIEMIRDPLTHIIRNAVDHGIEKPAERIKAGKREIGVLCVSARQSGNQILIGIQDDGRGIDGKRLVDKAISTGLVGKEEAAQLSPRDQLALIFEAGLSTAEQVTAISGRGVGMDVVRSNVERIGGIVEVDSRLGEGTRMTLRVPLTLTIIPALTVSIAGQHFAIPRSAIEEIVRPNGESVMLEHLGGAGVATIRGRRVPEVSLAAILGLDSKVDRQDRPLIVLRPAGGDVYALSVDRIHDHEELVVKPAAPAVMATGLYAGTTLADDGSPILLIDPAGLAEVGGVKLEAQERSARIAEDQQQQFRRRPRASVPRSGRQPPRISPRRRRPNRGSAGFNTVKRRRGSFGFSLAKQSLRSQAQPQPKSAPTKSGCSGSTTAITRSAMLLARSSTSRQSTMTSSTPNAGRSQRRFARQRRTGRADRRPLAVLQPCRCCRARRTSPSAAFLAGIRGCRTCFARSSKPPATVSSTMRRKAMPTSSSPRMARVPDEGRADIWLRSEPEAANKKDQHLPLRPLGLLMALKSVSAGRGK